jgi:DNA-binding NarL/FixJ family response regulator
MSVLPDQESESGFLDDGDAILPRRSITVLVVDDHALVRAAISQVLSSQPEIKCVVASQDYAKAEEQVAKLYPDIILLDMHIAHGDSIEEIRRLRKLSPDSRIMALADVENEREAFAAIMAGAQGYLSKQDVDPGDIIIMIQMLCRSELVLRPVLLMRLVQRLRAAALPLWGSEIGLSNRGRGSNAMLTGLVELTTREREILQLISQGYRDREIAGGLHLSEKTVQKHVQSILSKLGAQNRTEAAYLIHCQGVREAL